MQSGLNVDKEAITNRLTDSQIAFTKIAKVLSNRFGIVRPASIKVNFNGKGKYTYSDHKITTRPEEWIFLHEFAHHLNRTKYIGSGHDRSFKQCLWRVVKAYYGNVTEYPWDREYRSVFKYYERRAAKMVDYENKAETKRHIHELYIKYYGDAQKKREKFGVTVTDRKNGLKKVYLYPLYLTLRGQHRTDEEILVEFKKVADTRSEKYLRDKIKFFHSKKAA